MTRLSVLSTLALLAIGTATLPALAQTDPVTPAPVVVTPAPARALSTIVQDFEARGYRVLEVEVKRAKVEVKAITPAGQRIEADVDPVTGQTLREKPDT